MLARAVVVYVVFLNKIIVCIYILKQHDYFFLR